MEPSPPPAGATSGTAYAPPPAQPGTAPAARPWRHRPSVRALWAAAVFVLGLFVGGLVVGLTVSGPTPPAPQVTVTTVAPQPLPSSGAVAGRALVNAACLRAINESQTSYAGIQKLIDALQSLDAKRVDRAITDLQPQRTELRRDLDACRVIASVPSGTGGG
jgi:hypothetical protein